MMKRLPFKIKIINTILAATLFFTACSFMPPVPDGTTEGQTEASQEIGTASVDADNLPEYAGKAYIEVNGNVPYFTNDELQAESFEYYSPLDALGRCGVCVASIGTDLMPTEERGEIGSVKPSGWNQVKYAGLVEGNYLYNRCHLIGYSLSGENSNEKNLITGTRFLNVEGMLPFESRVAAYVKEASNHVMYRVTPIFQGDDLVASGVLMEARSVEDGGAGISFCVYCYNVQPGVKIDYSDGASVLEEGTYVTWTAGQSSAGEESLTTGESDTGRESLTTGKSGTGEENPAAAGTEFFSGQNYAVNSKNGKIHIVGACPATEEGERAMTDPMYFNTYEAAEVYSFLVSPDQKKRKCGNCW